MWQNYYQPTTLAATLDLLHEHAGRARLVAGGTDILVELQRGIKPTSTLIDVSALHDLKYVRHEDGVIRLGALATHNDVVASAACVEHALPLAQACWEVGAPQIRTRATVVGNVVTASPANDTITPLMALDAEVVLISVRGERVVALSDFYLGVRRTVLQTDEMVRELRFKALGPGQRGLFLKLGLRRAQAISVINIALVVGFDGDQVGEARIAMGCLAPTIVRASAAEAYLVGRQLELDVCAEAGRLVAAEVKPISDLRGTAAYRLQTLQSLVADGLHRLGAGEVDKGGLAEPVLLETTALNGHVDPHLVLQSAELTTINTTINGRSYQVVQAQPKTLLHMLRDDVGLTGTKEGCAEGECGACTVWLNGQAVMACLVPAPQANGASLTTIEGLAPSEDLHPLQQAFVKHGAVQCGYCIPGMLMAGAKLLEEQSRPDREQVQVALSGNICRCTGYRKILDAVQDAGGTL